MSASLLGFVRPRPVIRPALTPILTRHCSARVTLCPACSGARSAAHSFQFKKASESSCTRISRVWRPVKEGVLGVETCRAYEMGRKLSGRSSPVDIVSWRHIFGTEDLPVIVIVIREASSVYFSLYHFLLLFSMFIMIIAIKLIYIRNLLSN